MDNTAKSKKGIRPALLVIDVQNRYMPAITERDRGIAFYFINLLIDLFRRHDCPVIRIYHHNKENGPRPGEPDFEFPAAVAINPADTQVIKTYSDSFNKTDLDRVLREKGCNTLFLCGQSAVGCVLATKIGAMNHDYKAFIVRGAIMSHDSGYTKNVEAMFDAMSYDAVELVLNNC